MSLFLIICLVLQCCINIPYRFNIAHMVYFPTYLSLRLCLYFPTYLSLRLCLYFPVSTSLSLPLCLYVFVPNLSLYVPVATSLSLRLRLYISVSISLAFFFTFRSLRICLYVSVSTSISLRPCLDELMGSRGGGANRERQHKKILLLHTFLLYFADRGLGSVGGGLEGRSRWGATWS